jgi:hypothetical protein
MDLKALSPLLDPVLGQNMELGLCEEGMEINDSVGALLRFSLTLFSSLHIARGLSIVTQSRVKE